MATTKKTEEKAVIPEGYEEIMIPKADANEDKDLFIGINGENWLIPRGKKTAVPGYVAEEIRRSEEAKETLEKVKGALLDEGR